jgi:cobalamin biosynthesis protein CbiD
MARQGTTALRRGWTTGGWTTGACAAAAAARAAYLALVPGDFRHPVTIRLPRGGTARFSPTLAERGAAQARLVGLATLDGETTVEFAIVGRDGGFLVRIGA